MSQDTVSLSTQNPQDVNHELALSWILTRPLESQDGWGQWLLTASIGNQLDRHLGTEPVGMSQGSFSIRLTEVGPHPNH